LSLAIISYLIVCGRAGFYEFSELLVRQYSLMFSDRVCLWTAV
jgi:hypothetical protein